MPSRALEAFCRCEHTFTMFWMPHCGRRGVGEAVDEVCGAGVCLDAAGIDGYSLSLGWLAG